MFLAAFQSPARAIGHASRQGPLFDHADQVWVCDMATMARRAAFSATRERAIDQSLAIPLPLRKNSWYKSCYAQFLEIPSMTEDDFKGLLRPDLHKELLIDLEDRARAEAVKAFEMVRDRSGLDRKRARELEGQARFRMMEQGFEEVCALHGGRLLEGGLIPNSELKVFQPFMRFAVEKRGVILGLAAMPDRKVIPAKNKSRVAGVTLNYNLSPRFDFHGAGPKIGDIFALLLVSRHRDKSGLIDEIAVGVVDSNYSTFLFYEPLEKFLSGHADAPVRPVLPIAPMSGSEKATTVTLKSNVTPFVPPEAPKRENEDEEKK